MSKIQAIETAATVLMWLGLLGIPLLVYVYSPRFMTKREEKERPPVDQS
jgi:hypothetical protein